MAIQFSVDLNRPYLPKEGGVTFGEITIRPGQQEKPAKRHIALCIDVSGSMSGTKIQNAKEGARWVFGLLGDDEYVSITTFGSTAKTNLSLNNKSEIDTDEFGSAIDSISAGGMTDIGAGLREALSELKQTNVGSRSKASKRILLLSDGRDSGSDFKEIAQEISSEDASIISAGIGDDYDEETIRTLGEASQGSWTHLSEPGEIKRFFDDAVERAQTVVAAQPRLAFELMEGAEIVEAYRRLPQVQSVDLDHKDGSVVVPLPDLLGEEQQKLVLKFEAPAQEEFGQRTLAKVVLLVGADRIEDEIQVRYTEDPNLLSENEEEVVMDFRETAIRTSIIQADMEEAESMIETAAEVHPHMDDDVSRIKTELESVKKGGQKEKERVSRVVDEEKNSKDGE